MLKKIKNNATSGYVEKKIIEPQSSNMVLSRGSNMVLSRIIMKKKIS